MEETVVLYPVELDHNREYKVEILQDAIACKEDPNIRPHWLSSKFSFTTAEEEEEVYIPEGSQTLAPGESFQYTAFVNDTEVTERGNICFETPVIFYLHCIY